MELDKKIDPIELFQKWFKESQDKEIRDPNAMQIATVSKNGFPSVRTVLLKDIINRNFVFYTNYESRKSREIFETGKVAICFYWKSINRQVRVVGEIDKIPEKVSDQYFASRSLGSRIGAWESQQSQVLKNRNELIKNIEKFKKKFPDEKKVPRPSYWSGWKLKPEKIEFWLDGEGRIHERLNYRKKNGRWEKELLYP